MFVLRLLGLVLQSSRRCHERTVLRVLLSRGRPGMTPPENAALVTFLADCLLTGKRPIITDEQEAQDIAEAIVTLGIQKGLFDG